MGIYNRKNLSPTEEDEDIEFLGNRWEFEVAKGSKYYKDSTLFLFLGKSKTLEGIQTHQGMDFCQEP